ncbi:MAG TPA: hypothetical protein VFA33_20125 [Bryobacteraceae bacterium]|nr:hypothetical protein [Bryobacteraceae bacterium]
MSAPAVELTQKSRPAPLVYVLAAVMALFIGILIYAWIEAKKANPVMLDEQGRPRAWAALSRRA